MESKLGRSAPILASTLTAAGILLAPSIAEAQSNPNLLQGSDFTRQYWNSSTQQPSAEIDFLPQIGEACIGFLNGASAAKITQNVSVDSNHWYLGEVEAETFQVEPVPVPGIKSKPHGAYLTLNGGVLNYPPQAELSGTHLDSWTQLSVLTYAAGFGRNRLEFVLGLGPADYLSTVCFMNPSLERLQAKSQSQAESEAQRLNQQYNAIHGLR